MLSAHPARPERLGEAADAQLGPPDANDQKENPGVPRPPGEPICSEEGAGAARERAGGEGGRPRGFVPSNCKAVATNARSDALESTFGDPAILTRLASKLGDRRWPFQKRTPLGVKAKTWGTEAMPQAARKVRTVRPVSEATFRLESPGNVCR